MLEGLSCFDQSTKLKIQMNIDGIKSDMSLWDEIKENHIREVKSLTGTREAVEQEELIPTHIKGKDIENDHMIA